MFISRSRAPPIQRHSNNDSKLMYQPQLDRDRGTNNNNGQVGTPIQASKLRERIHGRMGKTLGLRAGVTP